MERKPKAIKSDIMSRVLKLYAAAIIMGVVIACRLVYIQFFSSEVSSNAIKLDRRIYRTAELRAHRGAIRARTGEPLATSIFRSTIEFDFGAQGFDDDDKFRENADSLSKLLAAHFGDKSAKEYYNTLVRERAKHNIPRTEQETIRTQGRLRRIWNEVWGTPNEEIKPKVTRKRSHRSVKLFRDVDYNEWVQMRTWPILGGRALTYTRTEHSDRIYPCGAIARSVVGRMDENGGANGLERVFDTELKGVDGVEWQQHIAYSFWTRVEKPSSVNRDTLPRKYIENRPPEDGTDVITTIDIDIQEFADRVLRDQVARQGAIWGTTMVMEVETGDLVAIANVSRDREERIAENYNHGFRSRTEPGSTFKLASMLALLDDAGVPITKTYDAGHGKPVFIQTTSKNRVRVTDSGDDGGVIDMKEALAKSSNTYFAQAVYEAYREDPDRFIDFLRKLHFDRKVCVGMPEEFGEMMPNFLHRKRPNWTPHESLIKIAFGQGGMEVTPLQVLTLYNAVANNGRMVAPRMVRELRRGDKTVRTFPVEVLENHICSGRTLSLVRESLEEAALTGTGKELFGEGKLPFRTALKTGTAEYAQNGIKYSDHHFVASMACYFPADKPRYTIMTSIYTSGKYGVHSGAKLAGPVNRDIAKFVYARDFDNGRVSDNADGRHYPTDIKGGSIAQIRKVSKEVSRKTDFDERRGWGRVRVDAETQTAVIESVSDDNLSVMPDVTGMGLKDALFLLEERGLKVTVSGHGEVRSQSIRPGTAISRGGTVTIVLK